MRNVEERLERFGVMADDMAKLMQVSPEFIERWAPVTIVYDLSGQPKEKPNVMSMSIEDGVVFDGLDKEAPVKAESLIDQLDSYDDALCWAGLGYLASARQRSVGRYGHRAQSNAEMLTTGFMQSVRAAQKIGGLRAEFVEGKQVKAGEKRLDRLAATLIAVTFYHRGNLYLATDSPTQSQIGATERLILQLGRRGNKLGKAVKGVINGSDIAEEVALQDWEESLRKGYLHWFTHEENKAMQEYIIDFLKRRAPRNRVA